MAGLLIIGVGGGFSTSTYQSLDWQGSLVLVFGLVPLLLGFTWAGHELSWSSPIILSLFSMALVFLGLFAWIERQAEEPIIAPLLFKDRIFTSATLVALLMSMGMFGVIIFLPLFVQGVLGKSAQESGQILMPMMLSFILGSIAGGQLISRTGKYKRQAMIGTLMMVIGTYLLTQMGLGTSAATVIFNVVLIGLGIGVVLPLLNVVVQNAFPYRMMGMVSATQQFVRSLGGIIIAPILGTVLIGIFSTHLAALMPVELQSAIHTLPTAQQEVLLNPQGLVSAETQIAIQSSFISLGEDGTVLYQQFITAVHQALTDGITQLFLVGTVFAGLAFLATFALQELELQRDEFFINQNDAAHPSE